jgi:protein-tyrosine phosphatase
MLLSKVDMIFQKSKQTYNGNIIDVHCHLLPGVDDGAESFAQALSMLAIAAQEGIKTVVATPHLVCDGSEAAYAVKVKETFAALQSLVIDKGLQIRLILGYELLLSPSLLHIDNLPEYVIAGSGMLLVEPHLAEPPDSLDELIYEAEHYKLGLILAHPERSQWLVSRLNHLKEMVDSGVLMQINAGSITGMWGNAIARNARKMVEQGLVHLIGTDAHSDGTRGPYAKAALTMMSNWISGGELEDIAWNKAEYLFKEHAET